MRRLPKLKPTWIKLRMRCGEVIRTSKQRCGSEKQLRPSCKLRVNPTSRPLTPMDTASAAYLMSPQLNECWHRPDRPMSQHARRFSIRWPIWLFEPATWYVRVVRGSTRETHATTSRRASAAFEHHHFARRLSARSVDRRARIIFPGLAPLFGLGNRANDRNSFSTFEATP